MIGRGRARARIRAPAAAIGGNAVSVVASRAATTSSATAMTAANDVTHIGLCVGDSHWTEPLDRAYAACEALARSHYENFPVASRLLPAAMRPHVARRLRLCPRGRRHRGRGTMRRPGIGSNDSPRGSGGCTPLVESADTASDAAEGEAFDRRRRSRTRSGQLDSAARRCSTICVSAFGQDTMTTRYDSWARRSSTTAADRRIRSGGWCCASPAYRDERARSIVGRVLHRAAAHQFLAGLRPRLVARAGSTCRATRCMPRRGAARISFDRTYVGDGLGRRDERLRRT